MLRPSSWKTIVSGLTVIAMMSLAGCDTPKEPPTCRSVPSNTEVSPTFPDEQIPSDIKNEQPKEKQQISGNVLNIWRSGDHDRAAELFVKTRWLEPGSGATSLISNMTEQQFIALPEAAQNQKREEMDKLSLELRHLCRYVLTQGTEAMKSGQYDESEKHFMAVYDLGKSLAGNEKTTAYDRVVGRGMKRAALDELIKLYHFTEQEEKLQGAQEDLKKLGNYRK